MSVQNLNTVDPFADEGNPSDSGNVVSHKDDYIHIRIQQRNGRKSLTTLQGLPRKYDAKKILKALKKDFACNGTVIEDATLGDIIQLQGDQRNKIASFLTENGIEKSTIKVHGF
ncbi:hypothetical protein AMATHDRAFT_2147 [Amanita thiersii Skay4041]|uniref:SUI1 domain-containing protein n=1 Tax=Amanita thiersii Skay4041 TaxID=703135 RepID=A0A2A9NXD7_9AGAR|nr:hypothetical protein AMATHDRAFT_2147 [Amanita thiersii Skay4041]